jgi:hypothetical protein
VVLIAVLVALALTVIEVLRRWGSEVGEDVDVEVGTDVAETAQAR